MTTDNTIGGPHIYYYRSRGSYIIVVLEYIITLEHKSWQSVFLVEETGVPGENHRPVENRSLPNMAFLKTQTYHLLM
jgi:hypothetical protein